MSANSQVMNQRVAAPDRPPNRLSRWLGHQLGRLLAISASLVSTYVITGILGLVFWTIAARRLSVGEVGVAGVAVAAMTLLGGLGNLGLGPTLITKIPQTPQPQRRLLVRSSVAVAGATTFLLTVLVAVAVNVVFDVPALRPLTDSPLKVAVLAIGTALTAVAVILDQAVLVLGAGGLQMKRNTIASVVKVLALLVMPVAFGGIGVFAAWSVGTLLSLPIVAHATRGGRALEAPGNPLVAPSVLREHVRSGAANYALNTVLMLPLQMLPIIVSIVLSQRDNGLFTATLRMSEICFVLPYSLSIGLFASSDGSTRSTLQQMRVSLPMALGICAIATITAFFGAPLLMSLFGTTYSEEAATILKLVVVASLGFAVKDHFVALKRVEDRAASAALFFLVFSIVELSVATLGAKLAGLIGLVVGWLIAIGVQATVMLFLFVREMRRYGVGTSDDAPAIETIAADDTSTGRAVETAANSLARSAGASGNTATIPLPQHAAGAAEPFGEPVAPFVVPADESSLRPAVARRTAVGTPGSGGATRLVRPTTADHAGSGAEPPRTQRPADRDADSAGALSRFLLRHGVGLPLFVVALGLASFSLGISQARHQAFGLGATLYLIGLGLMYLPAVVAALLPGLTDPFRRWVPIAMLMALQLTRVIQFPFQFTEHDELAHAANLERLLTTDRLFEPNPILPVTASYPGLALSADVIARLTGLSPHLSGVIVTGVARLIFAAAVYGIVVAVTRSARAAGVALLVYACCPQTIMFNSQYSYQTLALPVAFLALYTVARRHVEGRGGLVTPVLLTAAVALTHHLTSLALIVLFGGWTVITLLRRRTTDDWRRRMMELAGMTAVSIAVFVGVALMPDNIMTSYLGQAFENAIASGASAFEAGDTKELFVNPAGVSATIAEQLAMAGAIGLTGLGLLFGWWRARTWLRRRNAALGLLLILLSAVFVLEPIGHVVQSTTEIADRSTSFAFLGISFVIGWWAWHTRMTLRRILVLGTAAMIMFFGGVMLGAGPMPLQLPGRYFVGADNRTVDRDNVAAADWMRAELPSDSRVFADRVGMLLAASVGKQSLTEGGTGIDASDLLLAPTVTNEDGKLINTLRIQYLMVDERDSTSLPNLGFYVTAGEFGADERKEPVSPATLRKFSTVPGASQIYTNGSMTIYDLEGIRGA